MIRFAIRFLMILLAASAVHAQSASVSINNLPSRSLSYVVGHDASGLAGREPAVDFLKPSTPSPISGNIACWGTTANLIADCGKALPSGAIVGTSDVQTLTNKSISASQINSGTLACARFNQTGTPLVPECFGAVGNGIADDTTALQNWVNACVQTAMECQATKGATYNISSTIVFQPTVYDGYNPPYTPPSNLLFLKKPLPVFKGNNASVVATASMDSMFKFIFNSGIGAVGPYFAEISGFLLNGNNLASKGMFGNYTAGMKIYNNRITGASACIYMEGYGIHNISENTLRCGTTLYSFNGGLNDSIISHNDLYPTANGLFAEAGVIGSGDFNVIGNVCTIETGSASCFVVHGLPNATRGGTAGTSGSLPANTYYVQVTGYQTEDNSENKLYAVSSGIVTAGSTGSITVSLPNVAGYIFNVYVDTVSTPGHIGMIGASPATGLAGNQNVVITSIGAAQSPPSNPVNGHIVFDSNECNAIGTASVANCIYADGVSGGNTFQGLKVVNNHVLSANGGGTLIQAQNIADLQVTNNTVGGSTYYPALTAAAVNLSNVREAIFIGNHYENINTSPVLLTGVTNSSMSQEKFRNVGTNGSAVISIFGASQYNQFFMNNFNQPGAGYASYGITEGSGGNFNYAADNIFVNIANPYLTSGANSSFISRAPN